MNNYKKICVLGCTAFALMLSGGSLSSCSSGASEEQAAQNFPGIMTASDFASLGKTFQIFSTGALYIIPVQLMTPADQVTNRAEVFAYLAAETLDGTSDPVMVNCTYHTFGNATPDQPPTIGIMEVSFSSTAGQNNDSIVTALGLRSVGVGNVLAGLQFTFDFQTNTLSVRANGTGGLVVQPGDGGVGEDTNYEEEIYGLDFAVKPNSF